MRGEIRLSLAYGLWLMAYGYGLWLIWFPNKSPDHLGDSPSAESPTPEIRRHPPQLGRSRQTMELGKALTGQCLGGKLGIVIRGEGRFKRSLDDDRVQTQYQQISPDPDRATAPFGARLNEPGSEGGVIKQPGPHCPGERRLDGILRVTLPHQRTTQLGDGEGAPLQGPEQSPISRLLVRGLIQLAYSPGIECISRGKPRGGDPGDRKAAVRGSIQLNPDETGTRRVRVQCRDGSTHPPQPRLRPRWFPSRRASPSPSARPPP